MISVNYNFFYKCLFVEKAGKTAMSMSKCESSGISCVSMPIERNTVAFCPSSTCPSVSPTHACIVTTGFKPRGFTKSQAQHWFSRSNYRTNIFSKSTLFSALNEMHGKPAIYFYDDVSDCFYPFVNKIELS